MIKITVETGSLYKGIDRLVRFIENSTRNYYEGQSAMADLGEKIRDNMRENIQSSKKRPDKGSHNLENAIESRVVDSTHGIVVGIGEITRLEKDAPYFEVLDIGGYIPPANLGYFTSGSGMSGDRAKPTSGASGQTWTHTGNGGDYLMTPRRAITGIDYIGKAGRFAEQELNKLVEDLGTKFIEGLARGNL
jgi:hypothetical protein